MRCRRRVQGDVCEPFVAVVLVIRMMRCLVQERFAVQSFEAWDHKPFGREIENLVAENLQQFVLQNLLIVLRLSDPAKCAGDTTNTPLRWENPLSAFGVDFEGLLRLHAVPESEGNDAAGRRSRNHVEM